VQVDVSVICERPKIGPYRDEMRASLAKALGVETGAVMVKGKTNEKLGWIGKEKGLAVIAVATLESL
jgi:2-C-methyl-D-erythritol 2,4-cyclodiphosphate synthase